jgi:hypothetical protein
MEEMSMSETFWIMAEITVGIAFLGILSAVITAIMVPLLNKLDKRSRAMEILAERYAQGELTREQYTQMRQDLGMGAADEARQSIEPADGRDTELVIGSRQSK